MERSFAPQPESAAAARNFVDRAIDGTNVDLFAAMLLTSELVNNAIVHAQTMFDVRVCVDTDGTVSVAVVDRAPDLVAKVRQPSSDSGRGLALVDGIADAWGSERQTDTKRVWFRLQPPTPLQHGRPTPPTD